MNVIILDETLTQVSVLTNYESLTYIRTYNNVGGFKIVVNLNQLNATQLEVGRLIYLDSLRCGIIETVSIDQSSDKSGEILIATGKELKDVINQRVSLRPSGEEKKEYTQVKSEDIVRDLINKSIINPVDTNRKIDIFELGVSNGLGRERDFNTCNYNIASDIYSELLPYDELGLKCEVNLSTKNATLSIYLGIDRTIGQEVNTVAVFALELGTSIGNYFENNIASSKNLIYVGDRLDGLSKTVVSVPETNEPNGIARIETFATDYSAATQADLQAIGEGILKKDGEVLTVTSLTGDIEPDYELGDKITFTKYHNTGQVDLRVKSIKYTYSINQPESKKVTFGRDALDIARAFDSKISSIVRDFVK